MGATALRPPGPAPPSIRSTRSDAVPELALDGRPADERVVHRQRADARRVARVGPVRLHLLFRVRVPVVQIEGERHRSAMRRQRDEHALPRDRVPLITSQKASFVVTPVPSGVGHVISGATLTGVGGTGLGAGARRVCAHRAASVNPSTTNSAVHSSVDRRVPAGDQTLPTQQRHSSPMHARLPDGVSRRPGTALRSLMSSRNSMRVRALLRNAPSMALVTAKEFCFSHAAHRHAEVGGFHHHRHAERRDLLADRVGNLVRQALLNLQPAAEHVDEPRDLAEPDHLAARNVGDVALAEERQQMVLAQAVEVDVLDDHHLAIIDREQRVVQDFVDVGLVSAGQEPERLLDPLRRVDAALRASGSSPSSASSFLIRSCIALFYILACRGSCRRRRIADACTRTAPTSPAHGARGRPVDRRAGRAPGFVRRRLEAGARLLLARWSRCPRTNAAPLLERGIAAGETAMRLQPARPEGHFWIAANMGALAESFGLRAGLKYRKPIENELETVLRLDPAFQDGSADRALGRWYFKVPGLFGGSDKKAEEHLRASLTYDEHSTAQPAASWPKCCSTQDKKAEARARAPARARCPAQPRLDSRRPGVQGTRPRAAREDPVGRLRSRSTVEPAAGLAAKPSRPAPSASAAAAARRRAPGTHRT